MTLALLNDWRTQPFLLGQMSPVDYEPAFLVDMTANLTQRGTGITLQSIGTPVVQRSDSADLTTSDLQITNATVLAQAATGWYNGVSRIVQAGYGWTFAAQISGASPAYYLVWFPLTLNNGATIRRCGQILVSLNLG